MMSRTTRALCLSVGFAAMALVRMADAGGMTDSKGSGPIEVRAGTKRALIICGHPGDEEHQKSFAATVTRLHQGLMTAVGVPGEKISVYFGVDPETDDKSLLAVPNSGPATRDAIATAVEAIRGEIRPEDSLWIIVMGHGHFDGRRSWINLPGPDMHHDGFGKLFKEISCREQVFVITTPASGYFLKPLSAVGRAVISATEADLEVNETLFAEAFANELNSSADKPLADADEDGTLSLLDLYIATIRGVHQMYVSESLLSTEHALLDDNGDGRGTEIQRAYLTEEEGGRRRKGVVPSHPAGKDGALAVSVRLTLKPAPPTIEPETIEPPR